MDDQARGLLDVAGLVLDNLDVDVVVDRVLTAARELTGARYAALDVLGESGTKPARVLASGIGERTRAGNGALPGGRGVGEELIRDAPAGSSIGVPILVDGVPFGSIHLSEKENGKEFSAEDEESIGRLARFAGVAIDHARRYTTAAGQRDGLARTVAALAATTEITRAVGGETDLEVILELVATRGRALVGAQALLIELVDGAELVIAAAAGDRPSSLIGKRIPLADTLASAALNTQSTLRLEVERNQARFDQHGLGRLGVSAEAGLVVPLVFQNQTYGVLVALDPLHGRRTFSTDDQLLLEAFATSAATAVANAQSTKSELQRQRLAAAEGERERWARELHDETLQSLAGLRLMLSAARRAGGAAALEKAVPEAIEHVDEAIANLRSLVTDLRPRMLDEHGLAAALHALRERSGRQGLEVDSSIDLAYDHGRATTRHTAELETALYRISQEALNNAAKHGHAKRAVIDVHESQSTVKLTIRDDGDGFDPAIGTTGFGLLGMRERVQLLHGTIRITSAFGEGTTVAASFPVQRRAAEPETDLSDALGAVPPTAGSHTERRGQRRGRLPANPHPRSP